MWGAELDYTVIYLIDWYYGSEVQFPLLHSHFIASYTLISNLYMKKVSFILFFSSSLHALSSSGKAACILQLSSRGQLRTHKDPSFEIDPPYKLWIPWRARIGEYIHLVGLKATELHLQDLFVNLFASFKTEVWTDSPTILSGTVFVCLFKTMRQYICNRF